jgi:hypothetical protein
MALNETTPAWVHDRLSATDAPNDWRPDSGAALARFGVRRDRHRRRVTMAWQAATAAVVVALVAASAPSVRVAAERAWDVLFARDVSVLRVDMDRMPAAVREALEANVVTGRINHQSVASLDEASRLSGFRVQAVPSTLLSGTPELSVVSPLSGELTLSVDSLTRAAKSVGVATEVVVNPRWEGAHLRVQTGALALSEYGATTLVQSTPLTIAVPPGFDMPAFVDVAMRLLGYSASQATALSQRAAAAPVMFYAVPPGQGVRVTEVPVGRAMATRVRDASDGTTTLIWSTDARLYLLTGPITDDLALSVANTLE